MSIAFIALGSNLHDPASQLQTAVYALNTLPDSRVTAISRTYQSAAVGPGDQPDYLNAVLAMETQLPPQALLEQLQQQENHQGRVRTVRWGPRTLDLDILLYDAQSLHTDTLTIPHPQMAGRNFVLYPLADVIDTQQALPCGSDLATLLTHCPRGNLRDSAVTLHINP